MYCSECGKEIADNSKFCPECGENLSNDSSSKTKPVDETSDTGKDKNFTIFSLKGAGIVFVLLLILFFMFPDIFRGNPTNCQELSDSLVGKETDTLFGGKYKILKLVIKEVISEEPNNVVCIADGFTTSGDWEFRLEYDGEFTKWGVNN